MARGQRKTIEDKIAEKQEIIKALNIRIEKEGKELKALLSEQKQKEVEILYDFIKTSHLSLNEASMIALFVKQNLLPIQCIVLNIKNTLA